MKIGIDIHGVIDKEPEMFEIITELLVKNGHQVHVLTGREINARLIKELSDIGISYTHLFSITSYHKEIGTYITYKNDGKDLENPLIAPAKWNRTKADYAERVGLNLHIDDSLVYGRYFSGKTQYILFTPAVKNMCKLLLCGCICDSSLDH